MIATSTCPTQTSLPVRLRSISGTEVLAQPSCVASQASNSGDAFGPLDLSFPVTFAPCAAMAAAILSGVLPSPTRTASPRAGRWVGLAMRCRATNPICQAASPQFVDGPQSCVSEFADLERGLLEACEKGTPAAAVAPHVEDGQSTRVQMGRLPPIRSNRQPQSLRRNRPDASRGSNRSPQEAYQRRTTHCPLDLHERVGQAGECPV